MKHVFYQQLYEQEWQRRDHLQSAVGTPLSVLVLVGTALVLLAQKFRTESTPLAGVFWFSFTISAVTFALTVYMVIRSFYGYVYQRIPFPSQLLAYHEGLKAHYKALGTPGLADDEFDLYLRRQYIEAGDRNAVNNGNRGEYLHQSNRALILSLGALVICAVPHVIALRHAKPDPQQIQLVSGGVIQMPEKKRVGPPAPAVVPPKPAPPANIDMRTGMKVPVLPSDSARRKQ